MESIRRHGAELVVVGSGSVEQARAFRDEQKLTFPVYTDPALRAYRAAGLRHGLASSIDPRIAPRALDAFRHGFRQVGTQGAAMQQGGALVIAPPGRLLYHFVSRFAGDQPDMRQIVRALDVDAREGPG